MIDASVSVKWYLRDEDLLAEADTVRQSFEAGKISAIAPHLARYEVASALLVGVRAGRATRDEFLFALDNYQKLRLTEAHDDDELLTTAAQLLVSQPIGYYDGVYLALAEFLGGRLVTADEKFYRKARGLFPAVVWLGDIDL